jgi:hypothetical protein
MSITPPASVKVRFRMDNNLREDPRRNPSRDSDLNEHVIPQQMS